MYEEYYGFSEGPFGLGPDPRFLYMAPSHFEAFSSMLSGIREKKGIIVITGEVGVGKTTLIHRVLKDLDEKIRIAFVFFSSMTFFQILRKVLRDLGLPAREPDLYGLLQEFYRYLSDRYAQGDKVAIIIDEAQTLQVGVLQDLVRLLTRPAPSSDILKIVLVGQPELEAKLHRGELKELRDNISLHRRIKTLDMRESRRYIDHQLRAVGSRSNALFDRDAVERICAFAGGVPRVINLVCDAVFLRGYSVSARRIDDRIVREVLKDLNHLNSGPSKRPPRKRPPQQPVTLDRRRSRYRSAVLSAAMAASALIVLFSLLGVVFVQHGVPVKGTVQVVQIREKEAVAKTPEEERTEVRPAPTVTTERGSTLLRLARSHYGRTSPTILDMILEANPDITNVHLIHVKQSIVMPPLSETSFVLPARDNLYMVHLGTFIDRLPAGVFQDEPALNGKTVEVVPRKVSSRETWHRVLAGPFTTREEGVKSLWALRDRGFLFEFDRNAQ